MARISQFTPIGGGDSRVRETFWVAEHRESPLGYSSTGPLHDLGDCLFADLGDPLVEQRCAGGLGVILHSSVNDIRLGSRAFSDLGPIFCREECRSPPGLANRYLI